MRIIFSLSFLRSELVITWKPAITTINLNSLTWAEGLGDRLQETQVCKRKVPVLCLHICGFSKTH